jgi:hypothetical protein
MQNQNEKFDSYVPSNPMAIRLLKFLSNSTVGCPADNTRDALVGPEPEFRKSRRIG